MVTRVSVSTRVVLVRAPRVNACSRLGTSHARSNARCAHSPRVRNTPRRTFPQIREAAVTPMGRIMAVLLASRLRISLFPLPLSLFLSRSLCYRSCYGKPGVLTSAIQPLGIIDEMTLERGGRVPVNQAWAFAFDVLEKKLHYQLVYSL